MTHTTFNAKFRTDLVNVAETLGLEFISTHRQVENGTLMFEDPRTNCRYALYESGYIRRLIKKHEYLGSGAWSKQSTWGMYPLNRRVKEYRTYLNGNTHIGQPYRLAENDEQMAIFVRAITNYRIKNGK